MKTDQRALFADSTEGRSSEEIRQVILGNKPPPKAAVDQER